MLIILTALLMLFAAGLLLCVYLLFSVKRNVLLLEQALEKQQDELRCAHEQLRGEFEALRTEFVALEERTGLLTAPPPPPSGLNLTKRSQALRMLRRGDTPQQVAAALALPSGETALLAKVQKTTAGGRPS